MGAHGLRKLPALALAGLLAAACLLAGCQDDIASLAAREGLAGGSIVRLSEGYAVAARARGGRAEVLAFLFDGERWSVQALASADVTGSESVQLVSYDGETGEEWNTFVYGLAGPSVSRVRLAGRLGVGGQVVDGAWVVALRDRGLGPADIHWSFVSAQGGALRVGSGLLR
ncbi:MAG: hypothetical protein ACRDHD_11335 [Candidatus Limnocylindria bacterium]